MHFRNAGAKFIDKKKIIRRGSGRHPLKLSFPIKKNYPIDALITRRTKKELFHVRQTNLILKKGRKKKITKKN